MANDELLDKTLQYIKDHPSEWDQEAWRCDTGMCFAGTAVSIAGGKWLTPVDDAYDYALEPVQEDHVNDINHASSKYDTVLTHGTPFIVAGNRARRILGLTDDDADVLFASGNRLNDLESMVAMLKNGESVQGYW